MRVAKLPPIHAVVERIDAETVAVVAHCFRVGRRRLWGREGGYMQRPVLYGLSIFTLAESREHYSTGRAREAGIDRLRSVIAGRQLPYIGLCADLPGWGDFA